MLFIDLFAYLFLCIYVFMYYWLIYLLILFCFFQYVCCRCGQSQHYTTRTRIINNLLGKLFSYPLLVLQVRTNSALYRGWSLRFHWYEIIYQVNYLCCRCGQSQHYIAAGVCIFSSGPRPLEHAWLLWIHLFVFHDDTGVVLFFWKHFFFEEFFLKTRTC